MGQWIVTMVGCAALFGCAPGGGGDAPDAEIAVDAGAQDAAPGAASLATWGVELTPEPFRMGDRGELENATTYPAREVVLTRPFWIGRTEVTQAQWVALMGELPGSAACANTPCPTCPVRCVAPYLAERFANALSEREGLPACYPFARQPRRSEGFDRACLGYRLPTLAEWACAARAGGDSHLPAPAPDGPLTAEALDPYAWHRENSERRLQPVAQLQPNAFGLYDVLGNVSELVADTDRPWPDIPDGEVDPYVYDYDGDRQVKGGDVDTPPTVMRVGNVGATSTPHSGFRLARWLTPPE
ncbi:MAG: SUMF1/EgtB/PvdO family nonheme iron enzyme [Myxococcales bacterium]|nr:SUMF1/EgtB/PvdO family nonheme iron enzyme [Myxococcales bacterium]MCB9524548.1 SUMF1/EgtB/PvdO family nonheme iron enzyme [Myxococcales bacterium]